MPSSRLFVCLAGSALLLAACQPHEGGEPNIQIGDGWARATAQGQDVGGVFVTIRNEGEPADSLIGGSSPVAERVEIHESTVENGVMRMRRVDSLEIPANGQRVLAPGSAHLMLVGLKHPLEVNDRVPVSLDFTLSGRRPVSLIVRGAGASSARDGDND